MSEFEIIDAVCDSVNPLLLLLALGIGSSGLLKKDYSKAGAVFVFLFGGLLLVYSLMLLDSSLGIWKSFGGDYSTHTAFAIAVSIAITVGARWGKWLVSVFVLYVIAMLYQQYHSLLDIVTTSLVVGCPLLLARKYSASYIYSH